MRAVGADGCASRYTAGPVRACTARGADGDAADARAPEDEDEDDDELAAAPPGWRAEMDEIYAAMTHEAAGASPRATDDDDDRGLRCAPTALR